MVLKVSLNTGINRIRLEFKEFSQRLALAVNHVLIESDWNLKDNFRTGFLFGEGINRIRLEFKEKDRFKNNEYTR